MMHVLKRNIRTWTVILTAILLLILCTFTVHAENVVLKVGYSDSEGILVDGNGKHSGYAVAYLEEISKYTGWKYEYVHDSWKNCMDALESGELDLLVMADYTEGRGERFLFSDLSVAHNYTVLYASQDSDIYYQDYAAFDGCRIGVAEGTSSETALEEYLKKLNLDCQVLRFASVAEAREAMLRGEVEMIAASLFSHQSDVKLVDRFQLRRAYFAVGKQNQALMDQLNDVMQQVRIENPDLESRLRKSYYNVSRNVSNLYLTREEQLYLDSVGSIVIKGFDGRKPLGYVATDGSYQGILVDYLNYLGAMSGLEFIYEPAESISFAEHAAAMAKEDYALFYVNRSLGELGVEDGILCKSDELFGSALAYIKREDKVVTKYGAHIFAVNRSLGYVGDLLLQTNSKSKVFYFDTSLECMEAVLNGEAEMAILDEHVASYLLQKPVFADHLVRVPGSGVYAEGMCLYVPQQHRHLVSILNKTLEHVSEKQQMYMVSNLTLSHSYEYQLDDMLYEYGTMIMVSAILLFVILTLAAMLYIRINYLKLQKKETEALRIRLQLDDLTGVYNRGYFFEKAQAMIQQSDRELGIIRLNVCHFKVINELYGSEKGDRLLREIGSSLKKLSQEHGFVVGRFTADHFYLCIQRDVFRQIGFSDRASVSWLGMDLNITYGVYPVEMQDDIPISAMCDRADIAISANRQKTLEYIHFYSEAIYQKLIYEQEIESEMETALAERQFCIFIQPKYDIKTEQIVGGEALVRWRHPKKGMVPPGDFIGVFEKNGFILRLDYYVWEESCRFLAEERAKGLPVYPLSINVSRIHFYNTDLQEKLLGLLEKYQLEAKYLELEITESIYSEEPEIILSQCKKLQALGFRIAMDDFGSGYSSLNMLKRMPLDIIKMDLKFLSDDADAAQEKKGQDILRTQIELAHMLELQVVVEGLETEEQRDFIRSIGNCFAQGYYYSRPVECQCYESMLMKQV